MKKILIANKAWVISGIFAILFTILSNDPFFIALFVYCLVIKILTSGLLKKRTRLVIRGILLSLLIIFFGASIYVNYYLPHGPMIDTGNTKEVCVMDRNCREVEDYVEDLRNLKISSTAKYIRKNGIVIFFGLLIAYIAIKTTTQERLPKIDD